MGDTQIIFIFLSVAALSVSAASNMVFKKIEVQMGAVGSDDDMRVKICDTSKCCTTKVLSNLLSGEWRAKKKETWDGSKLGNCSQILFDDKLSAIEVTLLKDGKRAGPEVTSMVLTGQVGSDKKKVSSFQCGSYRFSASDRQKRNTCTKQQDNSGPCLRSGTNCGTGTPTRTSTTTPTMAFKKLEVQMGAVSSDDDIRVKICDNSKCCTTKVLSNLLSGEWVAKKKETWDGSKLGNCSQILFDDKLSTIEVSLLKDGKRAGPDVTSMVLTGQIGADKKKTQSYTCGGYKFSASDRQKTNFCSRSGAAPAVTTKRTTQRTTQRTTPKTKSTSSSTMIFKKIDVQMGAVGNDDDIRIKLCDNSKCCTTKVLSNLLSGEWVAKKKETWDGGKLGNCSQILFSDRLTSIEASILKNGKRAGPEVVNMNITGQIGKDKKNIKVFKCGSYKLSTRDSQKSGFCQSASNSPVRSPSLTSQSSYNVNKVTVQMGNDGTNDDVSLEICNEKSSINCCDTGKLSKTFSNDWSKNDKEVWEKKDIGRCKDKTFDACKGFDVAVKKGSGKDSLKVSTITLELADAQNNNVKKNFVCSNYTVRDTDTIRRRTCSLDSKSSLNCPRPTSGPTGTNVRGPSPTAKPRPSRLPTAKSTSSSGSEENVRINSFKVEMGNDGTSDPVTVRVCSDTEDVDVCCETPVLNKPGGVNWKRGGEETWPGITLGRCSGQSLPTKARTTVTNLLETKLEVTVNKKGKDNMLIDNLFIETENSQGVKRRFKCPRFRVDSERATQSCYTQFAKPSVSTARPGPCLRSGKNCPSSTTRPPFRSGSG